MAQINNGKGLLPFDAVAFEIERKLIEAEAQGDKPKRGRPKMPRADTCLCCGTSFKTRTAQVHIDMNDYSSVSEVFDEYDEDEIADHVCPDCARFLDINKTGCIYDVRGNLPPGWDARSVIKRMEAIGEAGYATILVSRSFACESGNTISIELGDVFPVARVGSSSDDKQPKNLYSIDIMVGPEKLKLFPWEFGIKTWTELIINQKDGELEVVYVGDEDITGYYQPTPEVREMLKVVFGDR